MHPSTISVLSLFMRWAIVGGGVLGTSLALRLRQQGHDVTLFEAADNLGGLAAPWAMGHDVQWDRHYHVTLLSDRRTNAYFDMLGLSDALLWGTPRTGYYGRDHVLRSATTPLEFLRLPDLTIVSKLRVALTLAYGSTIRSGRRMERLTAETWLRRWSGRRALDAFWAPLLRAKLGTEHASASAAFIWSTIRRLSAARRAGLDAERFGTIDGGYGRVFATCLERFAELGIDVHLATPVASVQRTADGLSVCTTGSSGATTEHEFDRVVVTTAAPLAARLCPDLLEGELTRLNAVNYVGIVCASMLLRRPLAGYYLTYTTDTDTPFTAVVEMTGLIDPAQVGGHTLVYLPRYTTADDPLFALDDAGVQAEFWPFLQRMYPDLTPDDVLSFQVSRVPQVFAVPTLGYSDAAPSIGTSVPGLYLAGSANLPFATLNVDDTLSLVDAVLLEDSLHPALPLSTVVGGGVRA